MNEKNEWCWGSEDVKSIKAIKQLRATSRESDSCIVAKIDDCNNHIIQASPLLPPLLGSSLKGQRRENPGWMQISSQNIFRDGCKTFVAFGQFLAHHPVRSELNNPRVEQLSPNSTDLYFWYLFVNIKIQTGIVIKYHVHFIHWLRRNDHMINLAHIIILTMIRIIIVLIRRSSTCDGVYPWRVLQLGERKPLWWTGSHHHNLNINSIVVSIVLTIPMLENSGRLVEIFISHFTSPTSWSWHWP